MLTRVIVSSSHVHHHRTPSSLRADPDTRYHTADALERGGGGAGPGDGIKESAVPVLSTVGPHSPVSCAVLPVTIMRILLIQAVSLFVCIFEHSLNHKCRSIRFFLYYYLFLFVIIFSHIQFFLFLQSLILFVISFWIVIFGKESS